MFSFAYISLLLLNLCGHSAIYCLTSFGRYRILCYYNSTCDIDKVPSTVHLPFLVHSQFVLPSEIVGGHHAYKRTYRHYNATDTEDKSHAALHERSLHISSSPRYDGQDGEDHGQQSCNYNDSIVTASAPSSVYCSTYQIYSYNRWQWRQTGRDSDLDVLFLADG